MYLTSDLLTAMESKAHWSGMDLEKSAQESGQVMMNIQKSMSMFNAFIPSSDLTY